MEPKHRSTVFFPDSRDKSLTEIHMFLQNFVDQSPPPEHDGFRWMVQTPPFIERLLYGVHLPSQSWQQQQWQQQQHNPLQQQTNPSNHRKCVLVPDTTTWLHDYSFLSTTFLGMELDLILHDLLTFQVADIVFKNTAVSAFCTYLVHAVRKSARARIGRANIAAKTQVDDRFLL